MTISLPLTSQRMLEVWETPFDSQAAQLRDDVIGIRRHLHQNPEPSGEETATTEFIQQRLQEIGVTSRRFLSDAGREVGVLADVTFGNPLPETPLIAIRCDIDGLRMPDKKNVPYRSRVDGVAHACGHDAHSAMVLGIATAAAKIDDAAISENGLRLRLLFQPAEETARGAGWLVRQKAMDGVTAILGMHVDPERPVGEIGLRYGTLTANCDEVHISIAGHGGHAARPHHTRDPVAASAQLIGALYQLLPRSVDSRDASVFSVGQISGGYAPNVIPESVAVSGTLRTTDANSRTTKMRRIREICDGVGQATGTQIAVEFRAPLNGVNNDHRVVGALHLAAQRVIDRDKIRLIDRPSLGGEDFSAYLDHAPGALLRLGCAVPDTAAPFLHSPLFDIDERCLSIGMRILFRAAVLLSDGLAET